MASPVKYYVYISDTKVDMLYPQIPKPLLKRIASELNINLKLLGVELGAGVKGNQSEETRYSKVKIVSKYIEEHLDVGTVEAPSTYFRGTLPMKLELINRNGGYVGAIFFAGVTNRTIIGLGGSAHHAISSSLTPAPPSNDLGENPSSLHTLLRFLLREFERDVQSPAEFGKPLERKVESILLEISMSSIPSQQFEFLAKTLFQEPSSDQGQHIVLGTPIYVALAD